MFSLLNMVLVIFLLFALKVIHMNDMQDILYELVDVVSHSITNLYKDHLNFLTPEESTICNKLF